MRKCHLLRWGGSQERKRCRGVCVCVVVVGIQSPTLDVWSFGFPLERIAQIKKKKNDSNDMITQHQGRTMEWLLLLTATQGRKTLGL